MSMNSWRVIPMSRMALRTTNSGILFHAIAAMHIGADTFS